MDIINATNTISINKFFIDMNQMGLWSAISAISAVIGVVIAVNFVKTRAYTRGLNFFIQQQRNNDNYPNKIIIEIRNYSGKTVIVTNPYFKFGDIIKPDENARCDSYVKEYEIKFSDKNGKYLEEVDILLRHKDATTTWIPIAPAEDDSKIKAALEKHKIGVLYCNAVWLEDRPKIIRIRKKI